MWKLPLVPHGQSLPERLIEEIQEVSRGLASKRISSQQTLGDFEESSHRCTTFQLSAFREAETLSLLQKKISLPTYSASETTNW